MTNGTEEDAEDDGTVRCICGYDDYPLIVRSYFFVVDAIPKVLFLSKDGSTFHQS